MDTRWLILILILSVAVHAEDTYRLDLKSPVHVTELPPEPRVDVPTRVEVYITGPAVYIEKAHTPTTLRRTTAVLCLTNRAEITNLMSVLQLNDNQERIRNVTKRRGYTFHLLLFEDTAKTVMHFRVFEPIDADTKWCDIQPRSDPPIAYFNSAIGPWLHARVKITNGAPVVSSDSKNKD